MMDIRQIVMELDRQFCKDCETGKEQAWASYFAHDGQMITQGLQENLKGKKQIEQAMKSTFALPELRFTWSPEHCEASNDETLAVTRGTSILSYIKDGQRITRNGNYTTIWKKVDGVWKISWDIGN